jgi:hypothetical protein
MTTAKKLQLAWKYRKPLWKYRGLIRRRKQAAAIALGAAAIGFAALVARHTAVRIRQPEA